VNCSPVLLRSVVDRSAMAMVLGHQPQMLLLLRSPGDVVGALERRTLQVGPGGRPPCVHSAMLASYGVNQRRKKMK
jgi:hypothetical protein